MTRSRTRATHLRRPAIGLAAGGFTAIAGALLPWATYESTTTERLLGITTDGPLMSRIFDRPTAVTDGWMAFALGLVLMGAAFGLRRGALWVRGPAWVVVVALFALVIFEVSEYVSEAGVPTYYTEDHDSLGPGLFVIGFGALLAAGSLVKATLLRDDAPSPTTIHPSAE